ncbi:MAG: hypothetical protein ACRD0A_08390 [Acidimicrobiales bacterium]
MPSRTDARQAKATVVELLADHEAVNGVGIARTPDGYAVKVNLSRELEPDQALPDIVGGVPVMVEVVGPVRKQL